MDIDKIYRIIFFKVLEGNVKIIVKTDIVDDRRDPSISLDLNDGRTLEVLSSQTIHISALDLLKKIFGKR